MTASYVVLEERGVLAIDGDDARNFLQGLISNDIDKVSPTTAIYAALLMPQGKYLFDFTIAQQGEQLLLETEAERLPALMQRLTMYKLRAKVDIADVSAQMAVIALPCPEILGAFDLPAQEGVAAPFGDGVIFVDPRLSALGARALLPVSSMPAAFEQKNIEPGLVDDYQALRHRLGVPEGSQDLVVDKATLLENGFEELNGVDFKKGCFIGQELTARMKYRALVKKRLMPIAFDGVPPAPGTIIKAGEREIGEIRSAANGLGLALLRLDRLADIQDQGGTLMADGTAITPEKPDWANFVLAGQA